MKAVCAITLVYWIKYASSAPIDSATNWPHSQPDIKKAVDNGSITYQDLENYCTMKKSWESNVERMKNLNLTDPNQPPSTYQRRITWGELLKGKLSGGELQWGRITRDELWANELRGTNYWGRIVLEPSISE
uniref:Uncharacterized protein n=1 Tax=Romanomermis culicivorax TaxID=13658 RepID=A0A915KBE2_ROMCU